MAPIVEGARKSSRTRKPTSLRTVLEGSTADVRPKGRPKRKAAAVVQGSQPVSGLTDADAVNDQTVSTQSLVRSESDSVAAFRVVIGLPVRENATLAETLLEWQMRQLEPNSTGTLTSSPSNSNNLIFPLSSVPSSVASNSQISSVTDSSRTTNSLVSTNNVPPVRRPNPVKIKLEMPTFGGLQDPRNPALFVKELERFKGANSYTDEQILKEVLKVALIGPARNWYDFMIFTDWDDFVVKF
jgi:hypothetical protein